MLLKLYNCSGSSGVINFENKGHCWNVLSFICVVADYTDISLKPLQQVLETLSLMANIYTCVYI